MEIKKRDFPEPATISIELSRLRRNLLERYHSVRNEEHPNRNRDRYRNRQEWLSGMKRPEIDPDPDSDFVPVAGIYSLNAGSVTDPGPKWVSGMPAFLQKIQFPIRSGLSLFTVYGFHYKICRKADEHHDHCPRCHKKEATAGRHV
jgi:hypothetical protein